MMVAVLMLISVPSKTWFLLLLFGPFLPNSNSKNASDGITEAVDASISFAEGMFTLAILHETGYCSHNDDNNIAASMTT